MSWQVYCQEFLGCSDQAAQIILKDNLNRPDLLTFYDWGGWLIWNYPQIKPSIDGRMHLWRDETGYSAFKNYYPYEQDWKDIEESPYNTVLIGKFKPLYDELVVLSEEGKWKLLYEDNNAALFVRNKNVQK